MISGYMTDEQRGQAEWIGILGSFRDRILETIDSLAALRYILASRDSYLF